MKQRRIHTPESVGEVRDRSDGARNGGKGEAVLKGGEEGREEGEEEGGDDSARHDASKSSAHATQRK